MIGSLSADYFLGCGMVIYLEDANTQNLFYYYCCSLYLFLVIAFFEENAKSNLEGNVKRKDKAVFQKGKNRRAGMEKLILNLETNIENHYRHLKHPFFGFSGLILSRKIQREEN